MAAGEIGIVNDANGAFKVFEGTGGTFSEGVRWLDIDALQIKLSNDQDLQEAFAQLAQQVGGLSSYAEIKAALDEEGYAKSADLIGEPTDLSTADTIAGAKAYADAKFAEAGSAQQLSDYYTKDEADEAFQPKGDYLTGETEPAFAAVSATFLTGEVEPAFAALSGTFASSDGIGITYDPDAKKIYLAGGNGASAEVDCADFIKDGMLSDAAYVVSSHQIVLTFNTESGADPISVDVGDLVDTYTAAENADVVQLAVSGNQFSASIVSGSITPDLLSASAEWVFDCN